ncbi:OLC1v1014220C1 [Oldenlandia corymbosa var. corymbosa]|uniref:OLC1v1014220C1 n=1 Tax=Oldenlandia corymbosa var. corymbosa TaxID=529605 RepID=A0AAV1E0J2_OLDCO|nr:OLC1v1014220C1 [Oldenlandia corymbosa var. corymbosa]
MAASSFMLPVATISLALLFFLPNVQSQSTGDCSSVLLQLAPCGPFVQGSEPSPAQFCCNTLRQLNSQQVSSLCLMLNDPSIGAFAVNKSLAFELPDLCNLPDNMSACSGMPAPLPPSSPTPQVSLGAKRNDTVSDFHSYKLSSIAISASPIVKVKPRPYAQGREPEPTIMCCDNLRQLNSQQVSCLCLLLNDNSLGSFAMNKTLARELPDLCSLQNSLPNCSEEMLAPVPPSSPTPKVSSGATSNATIAGMPAPLPPSSPTPQVSLAAKRNDIVSGMLNDLFSLKLYKLIAIVNDPAIVRSCNKRVPLLAF